MRHRVSCAPMSSSPAKCICSASASLRPECRMPRATAKTLTGARSSRGCNVRTLAEAIANCMTKASQRGGRPRAKSGASWISVHARPAAREKGVRGAHVRVSRWPSVERTSVSQGQGQHHSSHSGTVIGELVRRQARMRAGVQGSKVPLLCTAISFAARSSNERELGSGPGST